MRKRNWLYGFSAALLLVSACALESKEEEASAVADQSLVQDKVTATIKTDNDWGSGYCATVTLVNGGTAQASSWSIGINTNGSTISSLWNGVTTTSGNTVTVTPVRYNASISPNGTSSFGFCANGSGRAVLASMTVTGGTNSGVGGATATGGTTNKGGNSSTGGTKATGGTSSTGGSKATGGTSSTGGTKATGGTSSTGGSTGVKCSGPALTGGTQHCSSNASGPLGNYTWTIWSSGNGGCITTYGTGAAFKATWNNSGDFLSRVGLQWNETKTYDQYGTIAADFAYTKSGTAGGYSFIGIYGWSNNPLVEYYIVEDWFGSGPPTGGGTLKGTFTVDGGTYKVYTHTQVNQPSIHGTMTFPQFFSVRQTPRQCGHISISEHFKQWASYGMTLGKMYEAKILVEAGGGTGSIDFTTASVTSTQ
jgi:hypothetical protein